MTESPGHYEMRWDDSERESARTRDCYSIYRAEQKYPTCSKSKILS